MKKLIVLIDLHCDASMPSGSEEFGGGNMYTRNLLKGLLQVNEPFIYITRKKFDYLENKVSLSEKAAFFRIDLGNFSYNDKDLLQNYTNIAIEKINSILYKFKSNYEFVFHSFYWQSGIIALHLSNLYRTYYVHSVLSNAERKKIQGATGDIAKGRIKWEHQIFEGAKYIICSSNSEYSDLCSLYHIPKEKLFVTGRWIAETYCNPVYLANGNIRTQMLTPQFPSHYLHSTYGKSILYDSIFWNSKSFIYFGRIHENKGVAQIIQAWSELYQIYKNEMPALWIVGGAPHQIAEFRSKSQLNTQTIEHAEQSGKIIWWGALTPEGISTLMLKSLAVIMHSRYEAGGITVMEAMCQCTPVIATPFGFAKDYIIEAENGFLVEFNDIVALSQTMRYFINQPFLSNYLGRKAKYTMSKVLKKWDFLSCHLKLYEISISDTDRYKQFLPCEPIYKNSVDTFPYCFNEPEEAFICRFVKELTMEHVIAIEKNTNLENTYIEWKIRTSKNYYYFYYLYPLLNEESIYSAKEPYVFTPYNRISMLLDNISDVSKVIYSDGDNGFILSLNTLEKYL